RRRLRRIVRRNSSLSVCESETRSGPNSGDLPSPTGTVPRYGAGMRVGVLASGSGTILQTMLDRQLPIVVVLADRPCGALGIGEAAGVGAELGARSDFGPNFDRVGYTKEITAALERHDVDLVAIAGFGTILSEG